MTSPDTAAELIAGIRLRSARAAASPRCPGSGEGWEYGIEPTCQRCHCTPAQIGASMPVKRKNSRPGTAYPVWNGRVPRHDKPLDEMSDATREALLLRDELTRQLRDLDADMARIKAKRAAIEQALAELRKDLW